MGKPGEEHWQFYIFYVFPLMLNIFDRLSHKHSLKLSVQVLLDIVVNMIVFSLGAV